MRLAPPLLVCIVSACGAPGAPRHIQPPTSESARHAAPSALGEAPIEPWQPLRDGRGSIATDFELAPEYTCFRAQLPYPAQQARLAAMLPVRKATQLAEATAVELVHAFARSDFASAARHVRDRGLCVRGSPSGACVQLSRADLASCAKSIEVREWGWQSANESDTHATCGRAMASLVQPSFAGARGGVVNCPDIIAFGGANDSIATIQVQFFSSDGSYPWHAATLGFVEEDDKLTLVELTAAMWLP
jgi:hypothetical protein